MQKFFELQSINTSKFEFALIKEDPLYVVDGDKKTVFAIRRIFKTVFMRDNWWFRTEDDNYYKTIHIHEDWIKQAEFLFNFKCIWPDWAPLLMSSLSFAAWTHNKGYYGRM